MTPVDALEVVVARTRHERYRDLCDPDHPDYHPGCPELMLRMAAGTLQEPEQPPALPSLPLAGDLIAIATRRLGADRLARWVAARLGVDCGCEARRIKINALDAKLRKYLGIGG